MIYCELLQRKDGSAVYRFGGLVTDMTGEIEFFCNGEPVVIKEPSSYRVAKMWIYKLYRKYKDDLTNGIFKKKMSYEC